MNDAATSGTSQKPRPTKDRLIRTAADLFRNRGYHGVGLAELLAAAEAPKGSLYHHFPDGKSDLALAAATWSSDQMLRLIAESFEPADSFRAGATTMCYKLAKLFDLAGKWSGCPVPTRSASHDPDGSRGRPLPGMKRECGAARNAPNPQLPPQL